MIEPINAGVLAGPPGEPPTDPSGAIIDNRSGLPDDQVRDAIMARWVEIAGLQFGQPSSFQLYATSGGSHSMLNRSPFRAPMNVMEEIKLARMVAETDDDVLAAIGQAGATAFRDGMENQHTDEQTLRLFNRVARVANLDKVFKELYREYLIAGSVNTLSLYTRQRLSFTPAGTETQVNAQLAVPSIGVLPAENIRVLENDIFGNSPLAYDPCDDIGLKEWLEEFFAQRTTPARKNQMRNEQPVLAAVFTGVIEVPWNDTDMFSAGKKLYTLNPRMVHRTTMPKGASAYPRPPLTANFALLEAKRLLNIMDYALLQGGTNYIVIAKQGSDKLPAQQPEIDNLMEQVRTASRTGVLVGDHRLDIDIVTPNLTELLNDKKRKLVGRKITMALLRIPEQVTQDAGSEGAKQELELMGNTITSDRHDLKRHVERNIYDEIELRNRATFKKGPPSIWFRRIVLTGIKDFWDQIVQARDRGDIPRKWAVETLGFDYEAGLAQRQRELENGDDEILKPGSVPFSDPNNPAGLDGGGGRPPGSPTNPQQDPAQRQRQRRLVPRQRGGEPVRAEWDGERTIRYGELTAAVLEQFPEHTVGRVTELEREAAAQESVTYNGTLAVVPVNPAYEVTEVRAFRLDEGLSLIIGSRKDDGALVAKALTFREPQYTLADVEERAMRWGFAVAVEEEEVQGELVPSERPSPQRLSLAEAVALVQEHPDALQVFAGAVATALGGLAPNIHVELPGPGGTTKVIKRDDDGNIIAVEEQPA
jgi:hypothetical protein